MFYSNFSISFCYFSSTSFSVASWVFLGRQLAKEPGIDMGHVKTGKFLMLSPSSFITQLFLLVYILVYNWSCQLGANSRSPSIELFPFQCRGLSGEEDMPGLFFRYCTWAGYRESETPIVYPHFLRVPSAFNSSKPNLLQSEPHHDAW